MTAAAESRTDVEVACALESRLRGGCIEWIDRSAEATAPLSACFGEPGLWRWQRSAGVAERVFALPSLPPTLAARCLHALDDDMDDLDAGAWAEADEDPRNARPVRRWIEATSRGRLPASWRAPEPAEAATWLDAGRLSLRAGGLLAKVELDCREDRLRVVCAEVARPPAALAEARQAWLEAICDDAQQHWQLVRMAFVDGAVRAEIDLSGVPPAMAEPLVVFAFESLAQAVVWSLGGLCLLCDDAAKSRVLSIPPRLGAAQRTRVVRVAHERKKKRKGDAVD